MTIDVPDGSRVQSSLGRHRRISRHLLLSFLPVLMLFSAQWATAEESNDPPLLTTLKRHTRELMAAQSTAPSEKKHAATLDLCDFYVCLRQDKRYSESKSLQQDAAKIRRRLITAAKKIKDDLERKKIPRPSDLSRRVKKAIRAAYPSPDTPDSELLSSSQQTDTPTAAPTADSSAKSQNGVTAVDQKTGQAAGGFSTGWELIELIQTVVQPDFWESQGGPGTMRYFALRRILVVRATTDVHEQIRELLLKLPR